MSPCEPKHASTEDGKEDLSTILAKEERVELALLIANIEEVMRKQVLDTFDASIVKKEAPQQILQVTDKNPNVNDTQQEETEEEEKARLLREKREKELSLPKMLDLKKDSLSFFDTWREAIDSRVGAVINSPEKVIEEQKEKASVDATPEVDVSAKPKILLSNTNVEEADAALLPLHVLAEQEVKVAQGLLEAAKQMSGNDETQKRGDDNKVARRWKVGLAGVAGAAIIGVTGGLAAPLVAGAIGTVMGGLGLGATAAAGLLGTLAESGVIVGSLFGAYGGRMTGKMMDTYAKEVEDFAFLPLKGSKHHEPQPEDRRLRVTIGVSGWLTQKEDIITPWRALGRQSEVFALRWELEALSKLGSSLESVVKSAAWSVAKKEIIARTIFASLMDALWPLALLKVSKVVDNPFSVAKNRADKAWLVLADALINKAQGERPVTLIGYSLGARLIYSCLMSLAERRAFGLVESAVLIGTPAPSDAAVWRAMRSVVSGRLVNVYSENDYILAFLYRTSSIQYGVAGIQEAQDVPGIENINVSEMVSGHLRYQYLVGSILEKIGFEDIDVQEVEREEETLALLEAEEEKDEKKEEDSVDPEKEATQMEKDVKEKTDKKLVLDSRICM